MPVLEKTMLDIQPDDPWTADDHNRMVDLSVALDDVIRDEHGGAGDHAMLRFGVAGGIAEWKSGSGWALLRSDGIASISGGQNSPTITLARPMQTVASWGVVGADYLGGLVYVETAGKTRTTATLMVDEPRFTFIVVGPHAPL